MKLSVLKFKKHVEVILALLVYLSLLTIGITLDRGIFAQDSLDAALHSHDQLRAVVASLKNVQKSGPEQSNYLNEDVLPAVGDAVNDATILTMLKAAAATHGIELTRSNEMKPERADGVNWIGVTIGISATETALLNYLTAIERMRPVLVIDKLVWQSSFQQAADQQFPAVHTIEMNILAVSLAKGEQQ